ncbi:MAG: alpha/beta fold hydrolase [Solirubrobacteraceae bacterium]
MVTSATTVPAPPEAGTPPADLPGVIHRWVDAGEVRLHVAEAGVEHADPERPTIVLVHGWPQHWWCWHEVLPRLAKDHHVLAVDLRGHGWSAVPDPTGDAYDKRTIAADLVALVGALGLDRPVLVGHDWGGWTSLLAAGLAPERFRGVVAASIVAPWAPIPVRELWRFAYQLVAGGPLGPLLHRGRNQAFLRLVYRLGSAHPRAGRGDADDPYLERYRDPARAAAGAAMYRTFLRRELPALRSRTYAPDVPDLPILLVPAEGDGVLPPSLVRRGAGRGDVTVDPIAGAGHWSPEEQPDELVDRIRTFLDERVA